MLARSKASAGLARITFLPMLLEHSPVPIITTSLRGLSRESRFYQIQPFSSRIAICESTMMPSALSLRQGIAAKFFPP